jgi:hypothetical protein
MNLSICVDCLQVLANGVESDEQQRVSERMTEKWGATDISLGMSTGVWGCGHDHEATSEDHAENCEYLGFSIWDCQGCGSDIGGDRFAAHAWI